MKKSEIFYCNLFYIPACKLFPCVHLSKTSLTTLSPPPPKRLVVTV